MLSASTLHSRILSTAPAMDSSYNNTDFTLDKDAHKKSIEGDPCRASALNPQTSGNWRVNDHIETGWALDPFMGYVAL